MQRASLQRWCTFVPAGRLFSDISNVLGSATDSVRAGARVFFAFSWFAGFLRMDVWGEGQSLVERGKLTAGSYPHPPFRPHSHFPSPTSRLVSRGLDQSPVLVFIIPRVRPPFSSTYIWHSLSDLRGQILSQTDHAQLVCIQIATTMLKACKIRLD